MKALVPSVQHFLFQLPASKFYSQEYSRSPTLPRRRYAFAGLKAKYVTEDLKEAETLLEQLRAAENNASRIKAEEYRQFT